MKNRKIQPKSRKKPRKSKLRKIYVRHSRESYKEKQKKKRIHTNINYKIYYRSFSRRYNLSMGKTLFPLDHPFRNKAGIRDKGFPRSGKSEKPTVYSASTRHSNYVKHFPCSSFQRSHWPWTRQKIVLV